MTIRAFLASMALFFCISMPTAQAQSCTATATDIVFGSVDLVTGSSFTSSGQVSVRCTGDVGKTIRVCIGIGSGGGTSSGGSPRYMNNTIDKLQYNLYSNAAMTTIYGAYNWPYTASYVGMQYTQTVPSTGTFTLISPVYGKIMPSQTTLTTGSYISNFALINSYIGYDYNSTVPCLTTGGGFANTTSMTFNVMATAVPSCLITASDLDFGTQGLLTSNIDSTSNLKTRCSTGTPYNISLDGGNSGAASGSARKMTSPSGGAIFYNMFLDVARTQAWGKTIGSNTYAGTGTGISQNITVYGRIPPQTAADPGNYSDLITVTVNY